MNHLLRCQRLNNRYFVIRHGNSLANQQGIIVSHPRNGVSGYGLSETGRLQVIESVGRDSQLDAATIIVSSDFRRARETAGIIHDLLHSESSPCIDQRLRERNFGEHSIQFEYAHRRIPLRSSKSFGGKRATCEAPSQGTAQDLISPSSVSRKKDFVGVFVT